MHASSLARLALPGRSPCPPPRLLGARDALDCLQEETAQRSRPRTRPPPRRPSRSRRSPPSRPLSRTIQRKSPATAPSGISSGKAYQNVRRSPRRASWSRSLVHRGDGNEGARDGDDREAILPIDVVADPARNEDERERERRHHRCEPQESLSLRGASGAPEAYIEWRARRSMESLCFASSSCSALRSSRRRSPAKLAGARRRGRSRHGWRRRLEVVSHVLDLAGACRPAFRLPHRRGGWSTGSRRRPSESALYFAGSLSARRSCSACALVLRIERPPGCRRWTSLTAVWKQVQVLPQPASPKATRSGVVRPGEELESSRLAPRVRGRRRRRPRQN